MRADKKKQPKKIMDGTVIDQNLLLKAIRDFMAENKIIQREAINLAQIKTLPLSFLNIWKIEYLQCLDRLEKLQLDNNIIEKIENLDHLVNLKWLDLSFNRITKIEGLDKLVNLTDISLYNNRIEVLDGLGNCSKLNVLSIGNNKIKTFEEVIYYFGKGSEKRTKFKYLQVLNVFGNPFTMKDGVKDFEYENHMISHLPNLRYLDYVFIDEEKRKSPGVREIDEKFKTQDQAKYLIELKIEQEKERSELEEKKKKESAKMHLIQNFPEELVQEEQLERLQSNIKQLDDETIKFSTKVKQIIEIIQKKIKEKNEQKLKDIEKFEASIKHRERQAEKQTVEAIEEFERQRKILAKNIESKVQGPAERDEIQKLIDRTEVLRDKLLTIEIELVEDTENSLKAFMNILVEYSKVMEAVLAGDSGYFKKIDDEIKQFGGKLEKIAKEAMQNAQKRQNNGEEDENDFIVFDDMKDIATVILSIKEKLGEKRIRAETTVIQELCQKDIENYIKLFNERQYERSRNNINNVKSTVAEIASNIKKLIVEEEEDY